MATKKPIEGGLIDMLSGKIRNVFDGLSWFGPSKPMDVMVTPVQQPSVEGRQFDFPVAINRVITPRSTEAVSFAQLRSFADACDVLRIVIETRKDQIAKLQWKFQVRDSDKNKTGELTEKQDPRCEELNKFFKFPDKEHDWDTWLRMLLEDLLVIDAPCLYIRKTVGGELYGFEPVDGATIKRIIDDLGRTPLPPEPAYQQVLKGIIASDYTREEMMYRPRNVRTHKIYGYSPVEQIIMTVNIALRRSVSVLQYYTEGNIPEAIAGTPAEWNADQVSKFQKLWDSLMEGNTAEKRRMKFVPGKVDIVATKDQMLKDTFDEWLARIVCYAFNIEPSAFVAQVNKATAETAREAALSEGLAPIMQWVKNIMDYIAGMHFGYDDIEFNWTNEKAQDPLQRAQVDKIYIDAKVVTKDEVRADLGKPPLTDAQKEELTPAPPPMIPGAMPGQPHPPGAVPGKEGEEVPPEEAGKAKPPKAPGVGIKEAVAKAKKLQPVSINIERASILKLQSKLSKTVAAFLRGQIPSIAKQITAGVNSLSKAASKKDKKTVVDGIDLDWDSLVAPVSVILGAMTEDGGVAALESIGMDSTDFGPVTKWADDRAAEMVGKKWVDGALVDNPNAEWVITDSTREMLNGLVGDAIDEGLTTDELADVMKDSFGFSDERADMIARTETRLADSAGQMEGYEASGVVMGTEWTTSQDDLVSEECMANADAGVVPLGEAYPSGDTAPPAHPNCRCVIVAALMEEGES